MSIFGFLGIPLGYILKLMYWLVGNYGWALILFTLITRLILLPLNIKQQKSMVQMNIIKPKLDALEKQYGKDKEQYSQEMMKLYKKHGISPFSGCLPLLIQFPILFALFDVIKRPLTYIWGLSADTVSAILASLNLTMANNNTYAELEATSMLAKTAGEFAQYGINYNFFGLDLALKPEFNMSAPFFGAGLIWIIPIVAALTTYASSKLMNIGMPKPEPQERPKSADRPPRPGEKKNNDPQATANTMSNVMPFMTLWFTFVMPAGISIYWIAGNIIQVVQQYVINKFYVPKLKERMEKESEQEENDRKNRKKRR